MSSSKSKKNKTKTRWKCSTCGNRNKQETRECIKCGQQNKKSKTKQQKPKSKAKSKKAKKKSTTPKAPKKSSKSVESKISNNHEPYQLTQSNEPKIIINELKTELNENDEKKERLQNPPKPNIFHLRIRQKGKETLLQQSVTAQTTINEVKKLYKDQIGITAQLSSIELFHCKKLSNDKPLSAFNITYNCSISAEITEICNISLIEDDFAMLQNTIPDHIVEEISFEDDEDYLDPVIILDVGTYSTKSGKAGTDIPSVLYCRYDQKFDYGDNNCYPMYTNCTVTNWGRWEDLIGDTFRDLKVLPEETSVMLTEKPNAKKPDREKMAEIVFEQHHSPSFYLINKCVSGLYSHGKTTGLIIDSGFDTTFFQPITEGYALPDACVTLPIGGKHITEAIRNCFGDQLPNISTLDRMKLLKGFFYGDHLEGRRRNIVVDLFVDITGKYFGEFYGATQICEVIKRTYLDKFYRADYKRGDSYSSYQNDEMIVYELPDGTMLNTSKKELCDGIDEMLFGGTSEGFGYGVGQALYGNRGNFGGNDYLYVELRKHTHLIGGNTMISQLPERMSEEMRKRGPVERHSCTGQKERSYMSWIGGSILGSLSTFNEMWVTATEYEEDGAGIVNRKCF